MAKKTTKDFEVDLGLPTPFKQTTFTDDDPVDKAVDSVARTDGKRSSSTGTKKATTKKPTKKKPKADPFEKKRLTVDIPHYLNEALRDYCYYNRVTIKEVVHACLHEKLGVEVREKPEE